MVKFVLETVVQYIISQKLCGAQEVTTTRSSAGGWWEGWGFGGTLNVGGPPEQSPTSRSSVLRSEKQRNLTPCSLSRFLQVDWAAVHKAAISAELPLLTDLMASASFSTLSKEPWREIELAVLQNDVEALPGLLESTPVDMEPPESGRGGVLHLAARWCHSEAMGLILGNEKWKGTVNLADHEGWTPLHYCAHPFWLHFEREGFRACIQHLLSSGGDLTLADKHGVTPKDLLSKRQDEDLDLLLKPFIENKLSAAWKTASAKSMQADGPEEVEPEVVTKPVWNNFSVAKLAVRGLRRMGMLCRSGHMAPDESREAGLLLRMYEELPDSCVCHILARAWSKDAGFPEAEHTITGDLLARALSVQQAPKSFTATNGMIHEYHEFNIAGSNPFEAVVILPGAGGRSNHLASVSETLCASLAVKVLAMDCVSLTQTEPEQGVMGYPEDLECWSPKKVAEELIELTAGFETVHLYASSLTNEIGFEFGEALGLRLGSITLDAYTLNPLPPPDVCEGSKAFAARLHNEGADQIVAAHLGQPGVLGPRFINSAEFSGIRDEYLAFQMSITGRRSNSRLCHRWADRVEPPKTAWLAEKPILLLCGSISVVESAESFHSEWPQSELHHIPLVGQNTFIEAPDTMAEQMASFIKKTRIELRESAELRESLSESKE